MILVADTTKSDLQLLDADNFHQLHIEVSGDGDLHQALKAIGSLTPDLQHAWVLIDTLRGLGRPQEPRWNEQFDQMIAYARGKGWLNEDNTAVRVHIQRSE